MKRGTTYVTSGPTGYGDSLLEDLPNLREYPLASSSELNKIDFRGKNVILIDDIVRNGATLIQTSERLKEMGAKRVHALVLVGRDDGVEKVRKTGIGIDAMLVVPTQFYSVAFLMFVAPLLRRFRNGAISNWPHRIYRLRGESQSREEGVRRLLSSLVEVSTSEALTEIPAVDGLDGPIFYGTLELNPANVAASLRELTSMAEIDQAKVRIFIAPSSPVHLHLCGIAWLIADGGTSTDSLARAVSDRLLDKVESSITANLKPNGYTLERDQSLG